MIKASRLKVISSVFEELSELISVVFNLFDNFCEISPLNMDVIDEIIPLPCACMHMQEFICLSHSCPVQWLRLKPCAHLMIMSVMTRHAKLSIKLRTL